MAAEVAGPAPAALGPGLHFVAPTDTLQGIALQYNTTAEEILRLNNLNAIKGIGGRVYLRVPAQASPEAGDSKQTEAPKKLKATFKGTLSSHNMRNVSSSMLSVLGDLCHEDAAASMEEFRTVDTKSKLKEVPSCGEDFKGWFRSVTGREPKSDVVVWKCFMCEKFHKSKRTQKIQCDYCGAVVCRPCVNIGYLSQCPRSWVPPKFQEHLDRPAEDMTNLCFKCLPKLIVDMHMRRKSKATSV